MSDTLHMNTCAECQRDTTNPKFCSRACSVTASNRAKPKRRPQGTCSGCSKPCSSSRKYCTRECLNEHRLKMSKSKELKRCSICKLELPVALFGVDANSKDGLLRQCRECNTLRVKSYQQSQPKKPHWAAHGLTPDQYQKIVIDQNGLCFICEESPIAVVDHDHTCCPGQYSCGKCVRGGLCSNCNTGIGLLKDDVDRLKRSVLYLSRK